MEEFLLKKGNCLMVAVPGELDHHTAEPIRRAVDKRLEEGVVRNVVFDFRNTTFMDSSGIGMLMGRYRLLRYMGGTVTAIHVSDRLLRIMQLSGIHKFIEISQETVWTQKRK
ncbi:STAS domain-containing protein [Lactonifactor longoviformis]|nr:STAS domain-containing protein [Lactonifactor longoviformis]